MKMLATKILSLSERVITQEAGVLPALERHEANTEPSAGAPKATTDKRVLLIALEQEMKPLKEILPHNKSGDDWQLSDEWRR